MAEYLDKAGATYLVGKIQAELAGKVDTEEGKGLSANDFTNEEKSKLKIGVRGSGVAAAYGRDRQNLSGIIGRKRPERV